MQAASCSIIWLLGAESGQAFGREVMEDRTSRILARQTPRITRRPNAYIGGKYSNPLVRDCVQELAGTVDFGNRVYCGRLRRMPACSGPQARQTAEHRLVLPFPRLRQKSRCQCDAGIRSNWCPSF